MRLFHTALIPLLLALSACGGGGETTQASGPAPSGEFLIEHAQIFEPAGGRDVALGSLAISAGPEALRLVGASTPAATNVEIHESQRGEGGRVQMRRIEGLDLPAGETVRLGHGGPHLMLFGFDETLAPGDTVDLVLTLEQTDGKTRDVEVQVGIVDLDAPGS